jgi:hypothetical protein
MHKFHTDRQSFSNARLTPRSASPAHEPGWVKDFELTTGVVPHFATNGAPRWNPPPILKG